MKARNGNPEPQERSGEMAVQLPAGTVKNIEVQDGPDRKVSTSYVVYSPAEFRALIAACSDEMLVEETGYRNYARDLKARAAVRTSVAVVTPEIMVNKGKLNLYTGKYEKDGKSKTLTLAQVVQIINREIAAAHDLGAVAEEGEEKPEAPRAVRKARDMHVESGNATANADGTIRIRK